MILSGTTSQTAASFPDRESLTESFGQIPLDTSAIAIPADIQKIIDDYIVRNKLIISAE
jgi:hypothetical protein